MDTAAAAPIAINRFILGDSPAWVLARAADIAAACANEGDPPLEAICVVKSKIVRNTALGARRVRGRSERSRMRAAEAGVRSGVTSGVTAYGESVRE